MLNPPYVELVNLPKPDETCPKGQRLFLSGWGRRGKVTPTAKPKKRKQLWTVALQCLPMSECSWVPNPLKSHLCIGDPTQGNNTSWKGDSGGNVIKK